MSIKDIGLSRLPLVVSGNTFSGGVAAAEDLTTRLKTQFGPELSRVNAEQLGLIRRQCLESGATPPPGTLKLLDLLLKTFGVNPTGEATTGAFAPASSVPKEGGAGTKSSPPEGGAAPVTLRAVEILSQMQGTKSASRLPRLRLEAYGTQRVTDKITKSLRRGDEEGTEFCGFAWSQDSSTLRFVDGFTLHQIDAASGKIKKVRLATADVQESVADDMESMPKLFSEDSRFVYVCRSLWKYDDGLCLANLFVWNAESGELVTNGAPVRFGACQRLSADGTRFLSADDSVAEHDLTSGMVTECGSVSGWRDVLSTRDGSRMAGIKYDLAAEKHAYDDPRRVHLLVRGKEGYKELELEDCQANGDIELRGFSANGAYLLGFEPGQGLFVWDTTTGKVRKVPVNNNRVPLESAAAVSSDGRVVAQSLVSDGDHGLVQLYDVEQGTPLGGPIKLKDVDIRNLAFSPDDRALLVDDSWGSERVVHFGERRSDSDRKAKKASPK